MKTIPDTVEFDEINNKLVIIDQTLLPQKTVFLRLDRLEDICEAIVSLRVRGAPAIGVSAAVGVAVLANGCDAQGEEFGAYLQGAIDALNACRPTAVNLSWALRKMSAVLAQSGSAENAKRELSRQARQILEQDIETCQKIGENGAELIHDGFGILTHCNAGRLAAVRYGTALAPIYVAAAQSKALRVFCDETRPLLQGARLTAYELSEAGIDTTLICDNMAAAAMKSGVIDAVFVGADRIAKNGDTANKIGTLGVAVAAKHFGVPFYVCAPESTIDFECANGDEIVIEQRNPQEITDMWYKRRSAPLYIDVLNPAFDVTPNELISAIVTERGIFPPNRLNFV